MEIDVCPRWLLHRLKVPLQAQSHVAILLSALIAIGSAPLLIYLPHFCLMQKLLSIPCPGCGILHSIRASLRLDFAEAWRSNPAGIVLTGFFAFEVIARLIAVVEARTRSVVTELCHHGSLITLSCLLLVWISRLILGDFNGLYFLS
jgi:hypothetical protein